MKMYWKGEGQKLYAIASDNPQLLKWRSYPGAMEYHLFRWQGGVWRRVLCFIVTNLGQRIDDGIQAIQNKPRVPPSGLQDLTV